MAQSEQMDLREEWRNRVMNYRASGQSGAAWCADQGLKPHLLYYWLKRFKPADPNQTSASTQWLPVVVSDDDRKSRSADHLLVHIGNASIEIHSGFDADMLASVVRVLKALC